MLKLYHIFLEQFRFLIGISQLFILELASAPKRILAHREAIISSRIRTFYKTHEILLSATDLYIEYSLEKIIDEKSYGCYVENLLALILLDLQKNDSEIYVNKSIF